ncbi:uncharacterized protein [Rutidosis leptorrhynchoides]|uniref:uncharacterized protein n=1 Tax=Rutidosis leptorrhynchoides TaxID=125765 RepID=UPI003A99FFD2
MPWLLCGDLNEVRFQSDRFNSEFNPNWAMRFNDFINNLRLIDIPLGGKRFTRVCDNGIKFSKLDRFLISEDFNHLWPDLHATVLDRRNSDHAPIVLKNGHFDFGPKPTKVFNEWLKIEGVDDIIEKAWIIPVQGSRPDCIMRNKLKNVKLELKKCSSIFNNLEEQIMNHSKAANRWEIKAESRLLSDIERDEWMNERKQWFEKEKIHINMMKQKARVRWNLEGDENSRYFHNFVKRRFSKNSIHGIQVNGVWNCNPQSIKDEVYSFFANNFRRTDFEYGSFDFQCTRILDEDNRLLEAKFSEVEIWKAIQNCCSSKAPGPDGFNMKFFKKFWWLLNDDIIRIFDWFWNRMEISKGCNASFITLIPKTDNPLSLTDYRPISLIGSMVWRKWIKWIRACLSSATISVLVNGSPTLEFKPEKGVRQGDPISPFLFNIAAEGLNLLTKRAIECGEIKGISVGRNKVTNGDGNDGGVSRGLFVVIKQRDEVDGCFVDGSSSGWTNWFMVVVSRKQQSIGDDGMVDMGGFMGLCNALQLKSNECDDGLMKKQLGATTWGNIIKVDSVIDSNGIDFTTSFVKEIENGHSILFWHDHWLGNCKLKEAFYRLCMLDRNKQAFVGDRIKQADDGSGKLDFSWEWDRPISGRTGADLRNLESLLASVELGNQTNGAWKWNLEADGVFRTKSLSLTIDKKRLQSAVANATLRNKSIPQKVGVFVWRALQKRIPVRVELDKRGIDLDSILCPLCKSDIESVDHILVQCSLVKELWNQFFKWWNVDSSLAISLQLVFDDSSHLTASTNIGKVIWQGANSWNTASILANVHATSFGWISKRLKKSKLIWSQWLINPASFVSGSCNSSGIG